MDKPILNSFQVGLSKDLHDKAYPEGAYTFALNTVNESDKGDFSAVSTEKGTELCGNFPEGFFPNGKIYTGEDHVVFLYNIDTNESVLGLVDGNCNYTEIIKADCLNFSRRIQGTFRIFNGCDRIVYFCDGGNNPDRSINIDEILRNPDDHVYLDELGALDCELTKLKEEFEIPCIENIDIQNSGGDLEIGQYQIFVKYEDANGNQTVNFSKSHEFPIIQGDYGSDYEDLTGGETGISPTPITTNKSVVINVTNIDTRYAFIVFTVKVAVGVANETFYEVERLAISSDSLTYVLSTVNTPGAIVVDRGDVTLRVSPYDSSETITQHDNRLIRANLKALSIDYASIQRHATENYQVRYRWDRLPAEDSNDNSGSLKTSTYYTDYRSYMRDEIYSLGLVWVLKDGTELPAVHIPGRPPDTRADKTTPMPSSDINNHPRPPFLPSDGWDTALIKATTGFNILKEDYRHIPDREFTLISGQRYIERWKAWNTALKDDDTGSQTNFSNGDEFGAGEMAYWESIYDYPDTTDCEGNRIFPTGKVRHHKFPDTTLEPHFQRIFTLSPAASSDYVHPIGITVSNITPPTEIADKVQGYYIVRETRNEVNKSVLDKGIMYINAYFRFVQDCVEEGLTEYAMQSNCFNRHDFREGIRDISGIRNRVAVKCGLFPKNSSIDQDCGSMGFRTPTGSNNPSKAKEFLQYDDTSQSYHAPKNKFLGDVYNASYLKVEKKFTGDVEGLFRDCDDDDAKECNCSLEEMYRRRLACEFHEYENPRDTVNHRRIENYANIDSDTELPVGIIRRHFLNNMQQETLLIETHENEGLNNITDFDLSLSTSDATDPNSDAPWEGLGNGKGSGLYVSMKNYLTAMYGQIGNNQYFQASKCLHSPSDSQVTVYGGDIFITKFSFFTSSLSEFCTKADGNCEYVRDAGISGLCGNDKKNEKSNPLSLAKSLTTFFVESEINTELRHIDINKLSEADNTYWPLFNGTKDQYMELSNEGFGGDPQEEDCENGLGVFVQWNCGTFAKNRYYYSEVYSKERSVFQYSTLDVFYDSCKPCQESYPVRIAYSETGYQEERVDNYQVFLPLNYRDIPANTGEITNLFVTHDELFAHTERSLFQIYTKAQSLQADQVTLYIGTGEFFSIPPKEQINTEYAYGGSIEKFATIVTEAGAFYVDSETSKVFQITPSQGALQMQEISAQGLRNYFEQDGLKVEIKNYLQENLTESEYSQVASFIDTRTGFISTYDPRHKRVIITKKDYRFIGSDITETISGPRVGFNDPANYEDLSWTMSFSLLSNSWLSWHSYKPDFYMNNGNDFFSAIDSEIHKHNSGLYSTYYNEKYDQIIEFPIFGIETKAVNSMMWVAETRLYDEVTKQDKVIKDSTFTAAEVYNSHQATGRFTITPKTTDFQNVIWSNTNKIAVRKDRNWKISGIRDLTINDNSTITTSEWTDPNFQAAYIDNNFIDKVINSSVVDFNKSQFELGDMRDKVNYVRLFFKPNEDYNHILFILNSFNNMNSR